MSEFTAETRQKRASKQSSPQSRGRRRLSRHGEHTATTSPAKAATVLARLGSIPTFGRRAAVVAAACAVLVGVGAAGQAAEHATTTTATESATAKAATDAQLAFEKILVSAQAAQAEASVAPQPAPAPTPAAEPAPAEPAPEPSPAPAEPAPAAAAAPAPAPEPAPVVAVNDPDGAQAYAASQLGSYGWAADQMQCLQTLWTKESNWTTTATNASSGAYGIVQSLPAEKMASAGADYLTNYRTQINWGLDYVKERYGSPCGALNFHYANNWY